MTRYNFSLQIGEPGPLVKASIPDTIQLPMDGMTPLLKRGDEVLAGTKVAVANRPDEGDLHSPVAGTIVDLQPFFMCIETKGTTEPNPRPPARTTATHSKNGSRSWAFRSGISTKPQR